MNLLREEFVKNFNMEMVASDLMDLLEKETLEKYIIEQFNENFTYGELYDLFYFECDKKDLKKLLQKMGHDFVDLIDLDEEEKDKYY